MELKQFIHKAFDTYEESPELIDFKEELLTNLQDRLKSLEATGLKRNEALREIEIEFGDINKIADEMSLNKKKEVFENQYMSLRHFMTKPRAAIFAILGVLTAFALIVAGISFINSGEIDSFIGVLIVFLAAPLSGFVYMGLTQETATRHPMSPLRATIYAMAAFALLFGALLVPMLVFGETKTLEGALAVLIPFALPSIGVLTFLMMTEREHRKAWVLQEAEKRHEQAKKFESSRNAETFGMMSGAVWILAIGAFIFLLIVKMWIYSWIPFILAIVITLLLLAHYMKKGL